MLTEKYPLISVIIPCYNYEDYVAFSIESVLEQSYKTKEIIVVDDCSTDNSWSIIQKYKGKIKFIRTAQSGGAACACLAGLKISSGDFIYFLDADDTLRPDALTSIAKVCKPSVSKIQFPLMPIDKNGNYFGPPFPQLNKSLTSKDMINLINVSGSYSTPPTSGNVFRRDVFEYLGDFNYERWIDGISYLVSPFIGEVVTIDPQAHYRVHDRNASNHMVLSEKRFTEESKRFLDRLQHLSWICNEHKLDGCRLQDNQYFSFVGDRLILAKIASGQRPDHNEILRFIQSLWREPGTLKSRIIFTTWSVCLSLTTKKLAQKLAFIRASPWKRKTLFSYLK